MKEIQRFFEDYKGLENKVVIVEKFFNQDEAFKVIRDSWALYQKTFAHLKNDDK